MEETSDSSECTFLHMNVGEESIKDIAAHLYNCVSCQQDFQEIYDIYRRSPGLFCKNMEDFESEDSIKPGLNQDQFLIAWHLAKSVKYEDLTDLDEKVIRKISSREGYYLLQHFLATQSRTLYFSQKLPLFAEANLSMTIRCFNKLRNFLGEEETAHLFGQNGKSITDTLEKWKSNVPALPEPNVLDQQ